MVFPELAIERVEKRVRDGGHGIPEKDVRRRFNESLKNLQAVIPLCNLVRVYDNTIQFRKIATYINGECVDIATDVPEWCRFLLT